MSEKSDIINKHILIFGGTGSLGYELNKKYVKNNKITNFSRDENKHWKMKLDFKDNVYSNNINFIIGNIHNYNSIEQAILRTNPDIIIIAAANKHIDVCEINTGESILTNIIGVQNILTAIEKNKSFIKINNVIFISSDKACSPINNYGLCKAISETLIVEKSFYIPEIKFINVRYGNVLNSRGSIIPILHELGKNNNIKNYNLTHQNMTRFIMTLREAVDLIEYAILYGENGDTIIPKLCSMNIKDLLEIYAEKYNKDIIITGLRPGEKINETLINESQSSRLVFKDNYKHIKSVLKYPNILNNDIKEYNSTFNILNKDELKNFLIEENLL
jgi:UDP-glucose 4-epimerase